MAEIVKLKGGAKCHFCGTKSRDIYKYGPTYKLKDVKVHYYCVLLSNRLTQNGRDDEGILGFLLSDIKKELQRSGNSICSYCRRGKASISCASKNCRKVFHLPCGLENGSMHQFMNEFKSYCRHHRPSQHIPEPILSEACKGGAVCCICYDGINLKEKTNFLWAPCCLKTWYHRNCVQKLAYNAGYFFKCAICNDANKFKVCMERFGIFVPQQDASWERVPNAFIELMYKYDRCDAEICKCPKGRKKNAENTMWEIVLCNSCGSQGIHIACGNLKFVEPEWECKTCQKVSESLSTSTKEVSEAKIAREESSGRSKLSEVGGKKRRSSENLENSVLDKRKKAKTSLVEDEGAEDEVEIDVESVEEKHKAKRSQSETRREGEDSEEAKTVQPDTFSEVDIMEGSIAHKSRRCKRRRCSACIAHCNARRFASLPTQLSSPKPLKVLTSIKPRPLSHKLSFLRRLLRESQQKEHPRTTPDLIDLTCEDEDDDVEILQSGCTSTASPDGQKCSSGVKILCERGEENEKRKSDGTQMPSAISSRQFVKDGVTCLGSWKPLEILIED